MRAETIFNHITTFQNHEPTKRKEKMLSSLYKWLCGLCHLGSGLQRFRCWLGCLSGSPCSLRFGGCWGLKSFPLLKKINKYTVCRTQFMKSLPKFWRSTHSFRPLAEMITWQSVYMSMISLTLRNESPLPFISFFKTIILLRPCPLIQITCRWHVTKHSKKIHRQE